MSASAFLTSGMPSEADARRARETKLLLAPLLESTSRSDLGFIRMTAESALELPFPAVKLLADILDEMGRGNAVKIIPVHAELTTQEAADLLHVSRPTVIQMLKSGALPFRKVGTHRRIRVDALLTYKRKLDAERNAALAELTAYDREIGL